MEFRKDVLPGISTVESSLKMPVMDIPIRSTLVRSGDHLVMISPNPKLHQVEEEIHSLGKVTDLVAPNKFHNMGMKRAVEMFPSAKVWFPYGLKKKLGEQNFPEVKKLEEWPGTADLVAYPIHGQPGFNEWVFFHKPSQTLICADMCFNIQEPKGLGSRLMLGCFGTYRKFAVSRLFKSLIKEKDLFEKSVRVILDNPIENIIMAHGEIIVGKGREMLVDAFAERGFEFKQILK